MWRPWATAQFAPPLKSGPASPPALEIMGIKCSLHLCSFFVIFARHRGKLNLRARRKEKQGSKWVKQECGSNRILRREENFKVVGYRYPLHLRPSNFPGVVALREPWTSRYAYRKSCAKTLAKIGRVIPEICSRTDTGRNTQTCWFITVLRSHDGGA